MTSSSEPGPPGSAARPAQHVVVVADRFGAVAAPARDPGPSADLPPEPSWLPATAAAEALAAGWRDSAPHVRVSVVGASDGSAGYLTAIEPLIADGSTGDRAITPVVVTGPLGDPVPAQVLIAGDPDAGEPVTAFVETAQAAGAHLLSRPRDRGEISSAGVGELLLAALEARPHILVVGVGGLVCHDGGAGMLAALGRTERADDAWRHGLTRLDEIDDDAVAEVLAAARTRLGDTRLVLAHDRPLPLLGFNGASATVGAGTGPTPAIPPATTQHWENVLGRWADRLDRAAPLPLDLVTGRRVRRSAQAASGAGGGLGIALQALGASPQDATEDLFARAGLTALLDDAALLVLACPRYSWTDLDAGIIAAATHAAARQAVPVVLVADDLAVGRREAMTHGISASYRLRAESGPPPSGTPSPADLERAGARLATTWTPPR